MRRDCWLLLGLSGHRRRPHNWPCSWPGVLPAHWGSSPPASSVSQFLPGVHGWRVEGEGTSDAVISECAVGSAYLCFTHGLEPIQAPPPLASSLQELLTPVDWLDLVPSDSSAPACIHSATDLPLLGFLAAARGRWSFSAQGNFLTTLGHPREVKGALVPCLVSSGGTVSPHLQPCS